MTHHAPSTGLRRAGPTRLAPASLLLAAWLAAGCQPQTTPQAVPAATAPAAASTQPATANTPTPGPTFVGTPPAAPSPRVASQPSSAPSDMSKTEQSTSMPLPGQANDHSNPEPPSTQTQNPKDVKQ